MCFCTKIRIPFLISKPSSQKTFNFARLLLTLYPQLTTLLMTMIFEPLAERLRPKSLGAGTAGRGNPARHPLVLVQPITALRTPDIPRPFDIRNTACRYRRDFLAAAICHERPIDGCI